MNAGTERTGLTPTRKNAIVTVWTTISRRNKRQKPKANPSCSLSCLTLVRMSPGLLSRKKSPFCRVICSKRSVLTLWVIPWEMLSDANSSTYLETPLIRRQRKIMARKNGALSLLPFIITSSTVSPTMHGTAASKAIPSTRPMSEIMYKPFIFRAMCMNFFMKIPVNTSECDSSSGRDT